MFGEITTRFAGDRFWHKMHADAIGFFFLVIYLSILLIMSGAISRLDDWELLRAITG